MGKDEGAKLVTGGKRVEVAGIKGGYYYAPTIFANVNNKMRIAQEEIFGPVVCVIKYDSDEEAVAIANDSIYGLAGGVFSSNNPGPNAWPTAYAPARCGSTTTISFPIIAPLAATSSRGGTRTRPCRT